MLNPFVSYYKKCSNFPWCLCQTVVVKKKKRMPISCNWNDICLSPYDKGLWCWVRDSIPTCSSFPLSPNPTRRSLELKQAICIYSKSYFYLRYWSWCIIPFNRKKVIYLEACESGSIFEGLLPSNINIYATTASNASEDSFAEYCPGNFPASPDEVGSCLGDVYSVSWLEDRYNLMRK